MPDAVGDPNSQVVNLAVGSYELRERYTRKKNFLRQFLATA